MNIDSRAYTPITIGNWLLTFLILALPIVGLIMQFVWAFSSETHPSKRTFCQASLIMFAIVIGLVILFSVAFGGLAMIMGGSSQMAPDPMLTNP